MPPSPTKEQLQTEVAQRITGEIKAFTAASSLNRMPLSPYGFIFDEPMVQFAEGDDPIFSEYKTAVDPTHLTPREALAKTFNKSPEDLPVHISVISWILPAVSKTRESQRRRKISPSRLWANTRNYGEKFNEALREHVVKLITDMGYPAAAPAVEPYFTNMGFSEERKYFSNWSERHIAYAAGLGTFSLSDGFITERGIAHRCGSVIAGLALPVSPRTAENPYSNCLFYVNRKCRACIDRCPAGAISENGHDKLKCREYSQSKRFSSLQKRYEVDRMGCGLCQVKVPCEFRNPVKKLSTKAT